METGVEKRNPSIRKMAVLGAEGSNTHRAFIKYFNSPAYMPIHFETPIGLDPDTSFVEIASSVAGKNDRITDCALIPFHNSSESHFDDIPNLMIQSGTYVVDLCNIDVPHCLLSKDDIELHDVKEIYSNRHCFLQCGDWIATNLPNAKQCRVATSSEAAKYIQSLERINCAVIGPRGLSEKYKLTILADGIEKPKNITSFFVISNKERQLEGNPFSVYAVPVSGREDKGKIIERVLACNLQVVSSWFTTEGVNRYIFYLYTGYAEKAIKMFEHLMTTEFKGFRRLGRLNKDVSEYARFEETTI